MGRIIVSDNLSIDGVFAGSGGRRGLRPRRLGRRDQGPAGARPARARRRPGQRRDADGPADLRVVRGSVAVSERRARGPAERHAQVRRLVDAPRPRLEQHDGADGRPARRGPRTSRRRSAGTSWSPASSRIAHTLLEHDLVDELRLKVFPVVLGAGAAPLRRDERHQADAPRRRPDASTETPPTSSTREGRRRHGHDDDRAHRIGTRDEWLAAREALLVREKEHTRLGDELARERRALPWVRVEKDYRFDTEDGERTLDELFDGRSQLLVYHFMFGPSYEAGDAVNSSIADTIDALLPHLHARDVTFVLASGAPIEKLSSVSTPHGLGRAVGVDLPARASTSTSASRIPRQAGRDVVEQMIGSAGVPPIVEHNARLAGTDAGRLHDREPGLQLIRPRRRRGRTTRTRPRGAAWSS